MTKISAAEKMLTVEDLCGYLGVSKDYIHVEVRRRRSQATRPARQLSFRPVDVDASIESKAAGLTSTANPRLKFRVSPQEKGQIERAAKLVGEQVSSFVRSSAEAKADRILREHESTTTVPAEFFDDLIAAFDAPAKPNTALRRAAKTLRTTVARD